MFFCARELSFQMILLFVCFSANAGLATRTINGGFMPWLPVKY